MFVIFYKKYYNATSWLDLLKLEKQITQPLELITRSYQVIDDDF